MFIFRSVQTDYLNPNSLEGKLVVNLFDESDIEVRTLNNKKCTNWLGSIDIPLSAICSSEGVRSFIAPVIVLRSCSPIYSYNSILDILVHQNRVKNIWKTCASWFLGSYNINVNYLLLQIKGFFKLKIPHILIGYETEAEKLRNKSPKIGNVQSHQTYLEMKLLVQPNIPKLFPNMVRISQPNLKIKI